MKIFSKIALGTFCFISIYSTNYATEARVNQIPNGNKNRCANCHVNPNGGGTRNAFGTAIEKGFLSSGKVVWNSTLANLDSDGDGFTNGTELQDPNGSWKSGQTQPGNATLVTNPGLKSSAPTSVFENEYNAKNDYIKILSTPFNSMNFNSGIRYSLKSEGNFEISIYSETGVKIATLEQQYKNSGDYSFTIDDFSSVKNLTSGLYFINLRLNEASVFEKIYIMK